jgi:hypothetical protein
MWMKYIIWMKVKTGLTTLNDASQAFQMKFDNMENFDDMYEH